MERGTVSSTDVEIHALEGRVMLTADDFMVTPDGVHYLRVGLSPAIRKLANEGLVKLCSEEKVDIDPAIEATLDQFESQLK